MCGSASFAVVREEDRWKRGHRGDRTRKCGFYRCRRGRRRPRNTVYAQRCDRRCKCRGFCRDRLDSRYGYVCGRGGALRCDGQCHRRRAQRRHTAALSRCRYRKGVGYAASRGCRSRGSSSVADGHDGYRRDNVGRYVYGDIDVHRRPQQTVRYSTIRT